MSALLTPRDALKNGRGRGCARPRFERPRLREFHVKIAVLSCVSLRKAKPGPF